MGLTRPAAPVVLTALLAVASSSCGHTQDDQVVSVASAFTSSVADGDGEAACAVLAPSARSELQQSSGLPCPQAVLEGAVADVGRRVEVDAYGTMAEVRFEQDTLFLTRFQRGWRVLAAGCTKPEGPGPYDCDVSGG